MSKHKGEIAKTAFGFVVVIGIENFFADMTYEGARSITGPFRGSLGAQRDCGRRGGGNGRTFLL